VITELEEEGVRVALTVVDTPGFGDNIDNERWYAQVSRNRPISFQLRCLRSASARY
jgi:septin family protein